jgi:hypothetical protein
MHSSWKYRRSVQLRTFVGCLSWQNARTLAASRGNAVMKQVATVAALVCLTVVGALHADEPARAPSSVYIAPAPTLRTTNDPKCGAIRLDDCTRKRVDALRQLSDSLQHAADLPPAETPKNGADEDALDKYNRWLRSKSMEATDLAAMGERALAEQNQQTNLSFNMQFLRLQEAMQTESRQFTSVSNVLKTRHDTVKNSIANMR